jgi:hypothetical protein
VSEYVSRASGSPSGLTDFEREALLFAATVAVSAIESIPVDAAVELLEQAAEHGAAVINCDRRQVTVLVYGYPVVMADRARLRALVHPTSN